MKLFPLTLALLLTVWLLTACHWPGVYNPEHPRNPASWYIYTNQP